MAPELEEIAGADARLLWRFTHRVLPRVFARLGGREEPRELFLGPERLQRHPRLLELLQHGRIPVEIQFGDAVVGQCQFLGPGIRAGIQIDALHDDQFLAARGDHGDRQSEPLGLLHGLVPAKDVSPFVNHDGVRCA